MAGNIAKVQTLVYFVTTAHSAEMDGNQSKYGISGFCEERFYSRYVTLTHSLLKMTEVNAENSLVCMFKVS